MSLFEKLILLSVSLLLYNLIELRSSKVESEEVVVRSLGDGEYRFLRGDKSFSTSISVDAGEMVVIKFSGYYTKKFNRWYLFKAIPTSLVKAQEPIKIGAENSVGFKEALSDFRWQNALLLDNGK